MTFSRRWAAGVVGAAALAGFAWVAGLFVEGVLPLAASSSTVTVSASVTNAISCSNSTTTTAFGTLSSSAVATSTPTVSSTMACANDAAGCTLSINDAGDGNHGGLFSSGASHLIPSPNAAFNASTTLAAGTEGYGVQATTTAAGSGGTFTVGSQYKLSGNGVGELATTTATLVSTNATTSGREVVATYMAAISGSTAGGSYTDTVTYGCTAN